MDHAKMTAQMEKGEGFIAALDQSGGSTPKALKGYGVEEGAWSSDEEMFGLIHEMRSRIITSKAFSGDKVIGAILFERTMDGDIDGRPVPEVLKARGVVPFIKIDKGLEDEADGVQLMKPMPELDALLARAKGLGVFGTKERSVINLANREGIAAIVAQQVEIARQVLAAGLVPMLEPEINIKSPERAEADRILLDELLKALDTLPGGDRVMLKLSIPATPGLFDPLVDHPRVLRVVALSGGFSRSEADRILLDELLKALDTLPGGDRVMLKLSIPATPGLFDPLVDHPRVLRVVALSGGFSRSEACAELAKNRGMIASFSRALLEDLRHGMSDEEFDRSLGGAIDEIHRASTEKVAA